MLSFCGVILRVLRRPLKKKNPQSHFSHANGYSRTTLTYDEYDKNVDNLVVSMKTDYISHCFLTPGPVSFHLSLHSLYPCDKRNISVFIWGHNVGREYSTQVNSLIKWLCCVFIWCSFLLTAVSQKWQTFQIKMQCEAVCGSFILQYNGSVLCYHHPRGIQNTDKITRDDSQQH